MITRTDHDDVTAVRLDWWRSRVAGYSVCVYVVRGVLIDSGFPGAVNDITRLVRELRPRGAMITHQHEDHAGNVEQLARLGVPLGIDARTLDVVRAPHGIGLYRHFTWSAMPALRSSFDPFVDDTLSLDFAAGHSPDHHVVWDHATDTLFAGDLFLGVKVRVAHAYEDPRATVASLRQLVARKPTRVFCMHRGLVPDGARALAVKADWMEETIGRIEQLHLAGRSVTEIRAEVLGPLSQTHFISRGDYSPDNLVRAVLRDR